MSTHVFQGESRRAPDERGLTLIELVLAMGLLSLLMLAVVRLFDSALTTWRKGEARRAVLEQASIVADMLARDLRGIESGPRGDLVCEWVSFDTNGDGIRETKWPRLRLVREVPASEMARLQQDEAAAKRLPGAPAAAVAGERGPDDVIRPDLVGPGLVEVLWMVAPASLKDKDARSEGVVWRGARRVGDTATASFFEPRFFGSSNLPPAGATDEVTGGLLWMNVLLASQTSVVHDGWKITKDMSGAATSWDAWGRDRPDTQTHGWNEKPAGMATPRQRPILPRRVRIEFEFERPADRLWRTRTIEAVDNQDNVLRVDDGRRLSFEDDAHVLVDAEWMKVVSVDGARVVVERGARGTTPVEHAKDSMVHWGLRLTTEVIVATYREDWNL